MPSYKFNNIAALAVYSYTVQYSIKIQSELTKITNE